MNTTYSPAPQAVPQVSPRRTAGRSPERFHAEKLYAENRGLVGVIMRQFSSLSGDDKEDAEGAAMLGLWEAAQRFDPSLGFTFGTFAGKYIRGHILRRLKAGRQQQRLSCTSLETPLLGKDGDGGELADLIADPNAEKPGERLLQEGGFEALLAGLPAHSQDVLRGVYGEEKTLAEIGDAFGMTRQGVHSRHEAALRQARKREKMRRVVQS